MHISATPAWTPAVLKWDHGKASGKSLKPADQSQPLLTISFSIVWNKTVCVAEQQGWD